MGDDLFTGVCDQQYAGAIFFKLSQTVKTLGLKLRIANGECFINYQDVWLNLRLNCKCQPYRNAT